LMAAAVAQQQLNWRGRKHTAGKKTREVARVVRRASLLVCLRGRVTLSVYTFTGARKGVLETVAAVRTRRRHVSYVVPRNGSGEPARAWSPAWDTVAGGSLQWLPARVMSGLPRWHTQRCGRCQNSRYLYGQTRALPLSSTTCSARTSPSTILRHRPPVTRS
jgi:hypothetical protein